MSADAKPPEGSACWSCGGPHPDAECPHKFYAPKLPTPDRKENLLIGERAPLSPTESVRSSPHSASDNPGETETLSPLTDPSPLAEASGGHTYDTHHHTHHGAHAHGDTHVREEEEDTMSLGSSSSSSCPSPVPMANNSRAQSVMAPAVRRRGPMRRTVSWGHEHIIREEETALHATDGTNIDTHTSTYPHTHGSIHTSVSSSSSSMSHTSSSSSSSASKRGRQHKPRPMLTMTSWIPQTDERREKRTATYNRTPRPGAMPVSTGRLSILTLRYILAQLWALTYTRVAATVVLAGLCIEAVRYWKVSLLAAVAIGSALYLQRTDFTRNLSTLMDPPLSSPRSRLFSAFSSLLRDRNRVKFMVMVMQIVPATVETYALVVLFVCVHRDMGLAILVFLVLIAWIFTAFAVFNMRYGVIRSRITKIGLQLLCLVYLLGAKEYHTVLRLLGPALLSAGSLLLLTLDPLEVEVAVRSAITLMLQDVCMYSDQEGMVEDELMQVAVARWVLEYWDGPSDFQYDDFLPMMKHILVTLKEEMSPSVKPMLGKLQQRLEDINLDRKAAPLMRRLRQRLASLPPPKHFCLSLLFYRSTRHVVVFFTLCVLRVTNTVDMGGVLLPFAAVPLVAKDLLLLWDMLPSIVLLLTKESTAADGLSVLLGGNTLRGCGLMNVWTNLQYSVATLEGGLNKPEIGLGSEKAERFISEMKRRQNEAQGMIKEEQTCTFKSGFAMKELLRIKASPDEISHAGMDGAKIYSMMMLLYGDWLVHAPGRLNQWVHSRFTSTRASLPPFGVFTPTDALHGPFVPIILSPQTPAPARTGWFRFGGWRLRPSSGPNSELGEATLDTPPVLDMSSFDRLAGGPSLFMLHQQMSVRNSLWSGRFLVPTFASHAQSSLGCSLSPQTPTINTLQVTTVRGLFTSETPEVRDIDNESPRVFDPPDEALTPPQGAAKYPSWCPANNQKWSATAARTVGSMTLRRRRLPSRTSLSNTSSPAQSEGSSNSATHDGVTHDNAAHNAHACARTHTHLRAHEFAKGEGDEMNGSCSTEGPLTPTVVAGVDAT